MAGDGQPFLVQAVYSFKGKNNDELCFKKGDIITVTQMEDGGWWEGTFGDKTGWFPSNYVKEYKTQTNSLSPVMSAPVDLTAQQKVYRSVVLKDLTDSERAHVTELQGLMKNFLQPLEKTEVMKPAEYQQLVGNLADVIEVHEELLNALDEVSTRSASEQRVGRVFISAAPRLKQVLMTYCGSHPRAVCVLERYKQELTTLMEANGAASPGLLVLTTGLSKPFRRLEKYAGMLTELERHVEESHVDRGDTQRSVSVYKDIASTCSVIRRQKEMELEVVSGGVRGWEGEDLANLGDIIHMGSVAVGADHRDRYLVLFPTTLLMLSVSHRMSAFIYEGKLPLTGISINKLEDTDLYKNAFEIVGPMIDRIVAVCQTKEDQDTWLELIRQQIRNVRVSSPPPPTSPTARPVPPPHSPMMSGNNQTRPWSVSCLRPSPPLRCRDDKSSRNSRKASERGFEEDAQILRVIEAYCTSAKTRYTVNSESGDAVAAVLSWPARQSRGVKYLADFMVLGSRERSPVRSFRCGHSHWTKALLDHPPQVLIAEEEKIIVEDVRGDSTIVQEKSLVDTVYALKDEVRSLQCKISNVSVQLEEEKSAREQLQCIVHSLLTSSGHGIDSSLQYLALHN